MDNFTLNTELLIRYMDGEVTGQEKLELDRRLASDAALKEEFDNLRLASEAVKLYGIQEKVKAIHKEIMPSLSAPVRRQGRLKQFVRYSSAVAAAVVLVVVSVLAYNFFTLSSEKLYSRYHVNYELITLRGDSARQSVIEKAYQEKNYKGVTIFADKGKLSGSREELLAGLSWLEINNPSKAILHFKNVMNAVKDKKDQVYQSSEYYLSMAYLRNQDYDLALEIMENIQADPTHLYHKSMPRKLISKVKMLKWK